MPAMFIKLRLIFSLGLLLGSPLFAQHDSTEAGPALDKALSGQERRNLKRQVEQRDRVALYPADRDRFQIVGLAQGDNDFRQRTPALQNSDKISAQVDIKALRERLLAIHAGESGFSSPLPLANSQHQGSNGQGFSDANQPNAAAEKQPVKEASKGLSAWYLGLPLGGLALFLLARKMLYR
jgi:hypothetical protein